MRRILPSSVLGVLAVADRRHACIAAAAAIAQADVEVDRRVRRPCGRRCGSICGWATREQHALAGRLQRRAAVAAAELRQPRQQRRARRVAEEHARVGGEIRVEGHAEQAGLAARNHLAAEVDDRRDVAAGRGVVVRECTHQAAPARPRTSGRRRPAPAAAPPARRSRDSGIRARHRRRRPGRRCCCCRWAAAATAATAATATPAAATAGREQRGDGGRQPARKSASRFMVRGPRYNRPRR